jgi:uncharacterized protein (TIRG00374 family)
MKKKLTAVLKYLLFLGLGIFLVWWSLRAIPDEKWGDFKASLSGARYWLILPVFGILTLSHWLRAKRWNMLIEPMGYTPSMKNSFFAVMVGYLANLAVPRLGEVLKCTILARYEKIPADKLIGTIVAERAVDVISLGFVFLLAMTFQYDIVGSYLAELLLPFMKNKQGELSIEKILVFVIVLCVIAASIFALLKKFGNNPTVAFIKKTIKGAFEGLSSVTKMKGKGIFVLYSAAIWILYALGTWVGMWATIGTEHLGIGAAFSALFFASIGMIVTPGGIGAYALFLATALEKNGIPFELAFANGTLQWFAQFIIVLIWGFVSLGLLPILNKKKPHETS